MYRINLLEPRKGTLGVFEGRRFSTRAAAEDFARIVYGQYGIVYTVVPA